VSVTRADVLRVARSYLGTPFHHRGRSPGVGLDCAGVPVCVARELALVAPDFDVPEYRMAPDGTLLTWCRRYMREVGRGAMRAGDVLAFVVDAEPQHLGILADYRHGGHSLVHAAQRRAGGGAVIETRLLFSRHLAFVAAFSLPGVD
jgi:cell wall-associated NlpC family hydrolase